MNPDIVSNLIGLFTAIAVMCGVLCIAGSFCYAVAKTLLGGGL